MSANRIDITDESIAEARRVNESLMRGDGKRAEVSRLDKFGMPIQTEQGKQEGTDNGDGKAKSE